MKKLLSLLIVFVLIGCSENRYHLDEVTGINEGNLIKLKRDMSLVNGQVFSLYENGQVEFEVDIRKGKKHGEAKQWLESGELEYFWRFKNNKLDGGCKRWYKSGQLKWEAEFKDGLRNGFNRTYDKNGVLTSDDYYHRDLIIK